MKDRSWQSVKRPLERGFARLVSPDESPVGRSLDLPLGRVEVVGIVGDVRWEQIDEPPEPAHYVPRAQGTSDALSLVVRTTPGSADIGVMVRSLDPELPIDLAGRLDQIVSDSIAERRFYSTSTAGFALVALGLVAVVVVLASLIVCLIPARRAWSQDPLVALREV